jgi:hypothetical protein
MNKRDINLIMFTYQSAIIRYVSGKYGFENMFVLASIPKF